MANHKSAEKRARVSKRRNVINKKTIGEVRTLEKKLRQALAEKKKEDSFKALSEFNSKLAKAIKKGRIHYRTAARKVARLSKAVSSL